MVVMVLNTYLWVKMSKFSFRRHTFHFLIAACTLLLYVPRQNFAPVMTANKFGFTLITVIILQSVLTLTCAISNLHKFVVMLSSTIYLVLNFLNYFDVHMSLLCDWDLLFHLLLAPLILAVCLSVVSCRFPHSQNLMQKVDLNELQKVFG